MLILIGPITAIANIVYCSRSIGTRIGIAKEKRFLLTAERRERFVPATEKARSPTVTSRVQMPNDMRLREVVECRRSKKPMSSYISVPHEIKWQKTERQRESYHGNSGTSELPVLT